MMLPYEPGELKVVAYDKKGKQLAGTEHPDSQ